MSTPVPSPDPFEELAAALVEGDAEYPPRRLDATVLHAALGARAAGHSALDVAPIDAVEAFRRATASLDMTLASLRDDEWALPALRGLDVQGLVGHLIGVELAFQAALADPAGDQSQADHVASTDPVAAAQAGRAPSATLDEWRCAVEASLHALAVAPEGLLGMHGVHLPRDPMLVVRTFEVWTHEEDVRRATGRRLESPDTPTMRLMVDLAVELLGVVLSGADDGAERSERLVLTGPGGRVWERRPRGPSQGAADVRVIMGAVEFCRLVAHRVDPAQVPAEVTGTRARADELFRAAASLALD